MDIIFPKQDSDVIVEVVGASIRISRSFGRSFNKEWPYMVGELYQNVGAPTEVLGVLRFCKTEDEAIDIQRTLAFELEAINAETQGQITQYPM